MTLKITAADLHLALTILNTVLLLVITSRV